MSTKDRWGLYGVKLGASTMIGGITQYALPLGLEVKGEAASGALSPSLLSVVGYKPRASFSTLNIAAILDAISVLGASIAALGGLALYAQKRADGGTRAAGSVHRRFSFATGMILPTTLTCQHRGDASLGVDAMAIYDGTNEPLVITDGVAVPSAADESQRYGLGPFVIGGVATGQVQSLSINFGLKASSEGADGDIQDSHCSIDSVTPSITIQGSNVLWLGAGAIPLGGRVAIHSNTAFYLRKRAHGGTYVADATAEHIKFTADGLAHIENAVSASGSGHAECSITIPLRYDGTNAPIVVDTTAALP